MLQLLWLIPILPFASFFILAIAGSRISHRSVAVIGAGSVGLSALLTAIIGIAFIVSPPDGYAYSQTLWTWMTIGGFIPEIALVLDPLSLVMIFVITGVGFLIHLYSVEHMRNEEGYGRFFTYMNLFIGSMLVLVMADNLLFLYLGWEGVGLCSYLLIGFWYRDPANGYAARKAFVVTRIGDTALAVALFILYTKLGTLNIQEIMREAPGLWQAGAVIVNVIALLILIGALGKSAQVPLQIWLPDAMAGPAPVSALIHAATMVTAGVYLIARTNVLFTLAPPILTAVAIVGAVTLLLGGFSALVQNDVKRVLAYSTMSQIGYMFLALGVGAWSAAIFHFMVHAFFKALLFLAAGVIIRGLHHERDMLKMGGLRNQVPLVFWTFLIGSASLSAIPLVTAGFYSKDLILWQAWASPSGSLYLWAAGTAGAFLTALYAFRMVFLIFYGEAKSHVRLEPSLAVNIALIILAVLSLVGGFIELPSTLGNMPILSDFVTRVLPSSDAVRAAGTKIALQFIAALASLGGLYCAVLFFYKRGPVADRLVRSRLARLIGTVWLEGWEFDRVYDTFIIMPFVRVARWIRDDLIDLLFSGVAWYSKLFHEFLSRTQSGSLRWYASMIALGLVLIIAVAVLL